MLDRFERFSLAISEINKHWHKLSAEEMERHGLNSPHSVYLVALSRHPAGLTAPQLGELCGKDKADVSRMMKILEDKGLVRKEGSYGGVFLLTERGQAATEQVRRAAAAAVDYAGGDLSPEQRAAFYDALEHIAGRLRELSRTGIPLSEGGTHE